MSEFRLAPEAEAELDAIWLHIAREAGSADVASTERFWLRARYPYLGRARDAELRPGLRSFAADGYVIIYRVIEDNRVAILHVAHGSRDIVGLFGEG